MRLKVVLAVCITFLVQSIHVFGQGAATDVEWTKFIRPTDGFAIEFSEGFAFQKIREFGKDVSARGEFLSEKERLYLFIDFDGSNDQRKIVQSFIAQSGKEIPSSAGEQNFEFEDNDGFIHRIFFTQKSGNVYTVHAVSENRESKVGKRFIGTFKFIDVIPSGDVFQVGNSESNAVRQHGGGLSVAALGSNGSVNNSQSPPSTANLLPNTSIVPLKILSKRKAAYTEFARFYNVQGKVLVRVTFLASGKIGSVEPVQKLPFGLLENAISSAKHITFEPEMSNGVARNTTRPVSFSFNIY